jgi:hypothetical protein
VTVEFNSYEQAVQDVVTGVIGEMEPSEQQLVTDMLRHRSTRRGKRESAAVGFGVGDAADFLSPYVIAATLWYAKLWFDEGKSAVESRTRRRVQAIFNRKRNTVEPSQLPPRPAGREIAPDELMQHYDAVRAFVVAMGLDDAKADLLASAVVGRMITVVGRSPGGDDAGQQ